MAPGPAADADLTQLAEKIKDLMKQIEDKWSQLSAALPDAIRQSSLVRDFNKIVSALTGGVNDFLWDVSWYGAAWRDQDRWLNKVVHLGVQMSARVERLRPATDRRAGWRSDGSKEYETTIFGPKRVGQTVTQPAAIDRIVAVARSVNGTLGQFVGDVKNYGLAISAVLASIVVNLTASLAGLLSGPVGWATMVMLVAAAIAAYLYYRSAYEDYVTHLRINTETLRNLATESLTFFPSYRWPAPCTQAGWPYADQGRVRFVEPPR